MPTDGTGDHLLRMLRKVCGNRARTAMHMLFSMVEPCIFLQLFCKGFGPLCPLPFIAGKFLLNYDCGGKCVSTFSVLQNGPLPLLNEIITPITRIITTVSHL